MKQRREIQEEKLHLFANPYPTISCTELWDSL